MTRAAPCVTAASARRLAMAAAAAAPAAARLARARAETRALACPMRRMREPRQAFCSCVVACMAAASHSASAFRSAAAALQRTVAASPALASVKVPSPAQGKSGITRAPDSPLFINTVTRNARCARACETREAARRSSSAAARSRRTMRKARLLLTAACNRRAAVSARALRSSCHGCCCWSGGGNGGGDGSRGSCASAGATSLSAGGRSLSHTDNARGTWSAVELGATSDR